MWYINTQVTSSYRTRNDVDIQVRSSVVLRINVQIVRINWWLNYETVGLYHKYTGILYTHTHTATLVLNFKCNIHTSKVIYTNLM
jgi:hypothetical protein